MNISITGLRVGQRKWQPDRNESRNEGAASQAMKRLPKIADDLDLGLNRSAHGSLRND